VAGALALGLLRAGGGTALWGIAAGLAVVGCLLCIANWIAVARFVDRRPPRSAEQPPVTILKPLCGEEPLLEAALASCFAQAYPRFQIVFGLHDAADPALPVLRRLLARFPDRDVAIVIDPTLHGSNGKVSNLINMLPAARHDLLVISDSDLHLPAAYLQGLVAELGRPGVGVVTAAYLGLPPPHSGWVAKLGAAQINHAFLPGVLMSRVLGRRDCLGCSVMLHRDTLEQAGGLGALGGELAEDNVLGRRVRQLGLSVELSSTLVGATVAETSAPQLWRHELRWTRTIRASAPLALAGWTLQYPLFWASLAFALSGGARPALLLLVGCWAARALTAGGIDAALTRKTGRRVGASDAWMLPVRDILSVVEIGVSYFVEDVVWRGRRIRAQSPTASVAPAWGEGGAVALFGSNE
jgi:ceramide glucosyltransferase